MPIYKRAFNYCPFINGHVIGNLTQCPFINGHLTTARLLMGFWFFMPFYKWASFQCPFINRPLPIYKWVCYFWNLFVNRHVSRCLFTNDQATIWFIALYYKANYFTLNQLFMVLTANITTVASRGANSLCLLACTMLCITFSLAVKLKNPLSTCHWLVPGCLPLCYHW